MAVYEGKIWKVHKDTIIELPLKAWEKFGNGKFNFQEYHDFQELAWIQVSQYNYKDFESALHQVKFFDECGDQLLKYRAENHHKYDYVNLAHAARLYQRMNNWIADDKYWGVALKEDQSPSITTLAKQTLDTFAKLHNKDSPGNLASNPKVKAKYDPTQEYFPQYNSEASSDMDEEGDEDDGFWKRE